MNISNYQGSGPSINTPGTQENLVLARSSIFYGLKYTKVEIDTNSINRGVVSNPNFLFYDNNTKVVIDFSDKNNRNQSEIFNFWNLTENGVTFSVSNAEIYNDNTKQSNDLNGVYTFKNFENFLIFADVVSVNNPSPNKNLYQKTDFVSTINFKHAEPKPKQPLEDETLIVNYFGVNTKNSFKYLGAQPDDYIQLQSKSAKYKILNITVDSEGKELIKVAGSIADEDRIDTKTFVGIHVRKNNTQVIPKDLTDTVVGSCTYSGPNGIIVACLDNNTEYQCKLRQTDSRVGKGFVKNSPCNAQINAIQESSMNEVELLKQLALIRGPQNNLRAP